MNELIASLSTLIIILIFVSVALSIAVFVWLHNCSLNLYRIFGILEAFAKKNGIYDESEETINQIKSWASQGEMYYKQRNFEEAVRCYNKGVALEKLGKIEESKKCFAKAKELEEKEE
jgi:tetratricopeptide (TPR) repeat protein